jgi:hypothetical protein
MEVIQTENGNATHHLSMKPTFIIDPNLGIQFFFLLLLSHFFLFVASPSVIVISPLGVAKSDYDEWMARLSVHPQWAALTHQQLVDSGKVLQKLSGEVFERLASWSGKG